MTRRPFIIAGEMRTKWLLCRVTHEGGAARSRRRIAFPVLDDHNKVIGVVFEVPAGHARPPPADN
jgi:hypothetical protein